MRDLPSNSANQHLVKAIVGLAQDCGYKTIAEGVEAGARGVLYAVGPRPWRSPS